MIVLNNKKMKKIYLASLGLIICILISSLSSCFINCVHGSGHIVSKTRTLSDFSRISISGGFKVVLKQDSSLVVKITADDNLFKYIKTKVEGDKLSIYSKKSIC